MGTGQSKAGGEPAATGPEPVLVLENVQKHFSFTASQPATLLEQIIELARPRRRAKKSRRDLLAVDDVSLEIMPGEAWGIVGRNGSGKSTLLKLIARIIRPSAGRIVVHGRVSALLELGVGFHPDLTGRENIYLNAAVLGLSRAEIDRHYNSVVAFSELGEFINMPVKHYSSGMYMRLGFSVAIHVSPDILIVDEILAVGDQKFQEKCIQRIFDMKHSGVTIIMVSHNADMIRRLCTQALWMEEGHVRAVGAADPVIQRYLEFMHENEPDRGAISQSTDSERWGTGDIEITSVRLLNADGDEQQQFQTGDSLIVEMSYTAHRPIEEPEFGLAIHRQDGTHVNGPNSQLAGLKMGTVTGSGVVRYEVEELMLLPAQYELTVAIHDSLLSYAYDYHNRAYSFRVVPGGTREVHGLVALPAQWQWEPEEEPLLNPVGSREC